ncbi:MAG: oxygen-dependent coproporphyrinogen oxidase [Bacteroidota bacterium]
MSQIHQIDRTSITTYFQSLQDQICASLEALDGKGRFQQDNWERPGGGGGRSRVIQGELIEKGGVNFSAVHGELSDTIAKGLQMKGGKFYATGVSIVLHPRSPMMPIIHMNVRYFEAEQGRWWFGGGIDLTPHYVVPGDATTFHQHLKSVCDVHHSDYYDRYKQQADNYFYLPHRKETRGVGGIFFDRLGDRENHTKDQHFAFVRDVGEAFIPIYTELTHRNRALPFTQQHSDWQRVRRGRYVEFNLVWDRGTKFGLMTDGRTESILMSMPPQANWMYSHVPEADSAEAKTLSLLKKDIDWVNIPTQE